MATLRERLRQLNDDDAMRLVAQLRPQLLAKVAELRRDHLQGVAERSTESIAQYEAHAKRAAERGWDIAGMVGSKSSFRVLRAACKWQTEQDLRAVLLKADKVRKKTGNELAALAVYHDELPAIEARMASLARAEFSPERAAQFRAAPDAHASKNQRQKLGRLPDDWIGRIHRRTMDGKYGHAVAIAALIPIRPAEIAKGVKVVAKGGALFFEVKGAKVQKRGAGVASHVEGIGQEVRQVRLDQVDASRSEVFAWLLNEAKQCGGSLLVGSGMTASLISGAFCKASAVEFPKMKQPPSFYALRHAASAELKAAGLDAQAVAKGMGHASEASQQAYGTRAQGSGGYVVKTWASGAVRSQKPTGGPPSVQRKAAKARGAPSTKKAPRPR